ncbi:hypothetical protein HY571_00685, partial [Candidatus Micrarchaeota archaeon]|nr:hypothetical protein [Candidatus Micrarchaeota archaeon]
MPVALVEMGHGLQIVSLWKKGTTSLRVFLRKQPNRVLKQRACLSAMRRAAQLHAAGFAHGHLKPQNFVVDKNGNALLVDYTLMREDWSEVGKSGIALAEQLSA